MIEFQQLILQNNNFKNICSGDINCNSFLFESADEVFLKNFSYCFSQFLMCDGDKKPCNHCQNCEKIKLLSHADLKIYPEARQNILVEDVKDLIENVSLTPVESDKKIFVFNNFSSANIQSQNKLLKILEEPPKNVFIILNVTNINKVLPTILSRCKKFRLSALTNDELKTFVDFGSKSQDEIQTILDISQGSLTKTLKYSNDENFSKVFSKCIDTLLNMNNSSVLLKYSTSLMQEKESFFYILEIFESIFRDVLLLRLNKQDLIKNKNMIENIKKIASDVDSDATDLIIKKIYQTKKQAELNCNQNLLVDSLLLYILEVKYLCKKR